MGLEAINPLTNQAKHIYIALRMVSGSELCRLFTGLMYSLSPTQQHQIASKH